MRDYLNGTEVSSGCLSMNEPTHFKPLETVVTKNAAAAALGSLGGKARAARMSPEQRTESATHAAEERWRREKAK